MCRAFHPIPPGPDSSGLLFEHRLLGSAVSAASAGVGVGGSDGEGEGVEAARLATARWRVEAGRSDARGAGVGGRVSKEGPTVVLPAETLGEDSTNFLVAKIEKLTAKQTACTMSRLFGCL